MFGFNTQPQQPIGESANVEQQQAIPFYQTAQELGKLMLETKEENRSAYLALLGKIELEGELVEISDPHMNKDGAANMFLLMHKLNNKETFLTKLTDNDVVTSTRRLWKIIIKLLIKNESDWNLPKDRARWSMIREIVITPIYHAFRRGENGLEKEFFKATHESKTLVNQNSAQQFKKGFFE